MDREPDDGYLAELEPATEPRPRHPWLVAALVAVVAAGAATVVYAFPARSHRVAVPRPVTHKRHDHVAPAPPTPVKPDPVAVATVLRALKATAGTGSFTTTYKMWQTQPTTPSTVPCENDGIVTLSARGLGSSSMPVVPTPTPQPPPAPCLPGPADVTVSGHAIIDTQPFAMVSESNVSSLGAITVRIDGTNVWESGGADYGLTPGRGTGGPGAPLSGFSGLVEETLGGRLGAGAMQSMASPTGYLTIEAQMVTTATPTGTGTVDGVPVTLYQLQVDFAHLDSIPNTTPEEQTTIAAASRVLEQSGYTHSVVTLAIDASNLIRESKSVAMFDDGATAVADSVFSGFGCSGRVEMPGATTPAAPTPPCTTTPSAQP